MLRNGGGKGTRTELAWRRAEKPFGVLRGGQIGGKPAGFLWGPPDQRLVFPDDFAPRRARVQRPCRGSGLSDLPFYPRVGNTLIA